MEESSYKHNYEYLSIEEAKAIVNGTFVQGTTNIGGELATKDDIDKLLTAADKKLTSIVPSTEISNEFVCFFECVDNRVDPTGVHVTNIIIQVGQNKKIKYELTPSNATVDTCTYEVTSGSEYVHITDGVVYADAVGEAICKITINGTIESTFQVSVTDSNIIDLDCDIIAIQNCEIEVGLYAMSHQLDTGTTSVISWHGDAFASGCSISGYDGSWSLINFDKLREFYELIKNEQSQVKGKTIEQMCQSDYGPSIKIDFIDSLRTKDKYTEVIPDEKRTYKILRFKKESSSASITSNYGTVYISGYSLKEDTVFSSLVHGCSGVNAVSYYLKTDTIVATNYFFPEDNAKWSTSNLIVPKEGQYIYKGYQTKYQESAPEIYGAISPNVDAELINVNKSGTIYTGQIKINSIDGNTDISNIYGYLKFRYRTTHENLAAECGDQKNGLYNLTNIKTLPYTFNFEINNKYGTGIYVQPIYFYTTDKELINNHFFVENGTQLTKSIVDVIQ